MNITIYNTQNREQKYTIRYRPTYDKVIDGTFLIENEHGKKIILSEKELFDSMNHILKLIVKDKEIS